MPLNQCNFIGNLTRDPEMRYTPSNTAVTSFGLAINHKYKTKDGEAKEEVTFIDCEAWGKTGEIISQYVKKGSPIFLTCRAKLDEWQDKDSGQKRSKMKFVVEQFTFIGGKQSAGEESQGESQHGSDNQTRQPARKPQAKAGTQRSFNSIPDDQEQEVPF